MKNLCFLLTLLLAMSWAQAQVGIGTVSPNSMLDLRGSFAPICRSFSGTTSLTVNDHTLVFTGTVAATATLPDATACPGRMYDLKNYSATLPAPVLTINTISAQTIDGGSSWLLNTSNQSVTLVSDGANWEVFGQSVSSASGSAWALGGNSVVATSTLGTTTAYDLPFITNNTEKMRITSAGSVGIGTTAFSANPEALLVYQNSSTSFNVIGGKGSLNNYLQLNIQNLNSGSSASSDVVATADNGNETINYVDLGMNSSTYNTAAITGGADNAYLYSAANDFIIGNSTAAKNLIFFTGGTATTNEAMRINGSGDVGIGTTTLSYKLQVSSAANPLYLAGVQTGTSSDSILTIVNGVVRKLQPGALVTSSNNAWSLVGNAGTTPGTNFIGTTDAQAVILKENNTQVGDFQQNSIALGLGATTANSQNCYALGSGANIGFNKVSALAIGTNAGVSNDSAFAIGVAAATSGQNAFSIGSASQANSANSFAIGRNAYVGYSIIDGVAIGTNATSAGANSLAIGSNTTVANKTQANAASAIAVGNAAVANSANAIAIGTGATVGYTLTNPVAIGDGAVVNGSNGLALGNGANISYVTNATALGANASVTNTGNNSTAVGYNAAATLTNELILGDRSNASLSVGIGTESFSSTNREKLLVDMGTTSSVNAIVARGTNPSYVQLNIQNLSNGSSASSDVVATADNGNETTNYVDMGMNSSTYSAGTVTGGADNAYLYSSASDFVIGNSTAGKNLIFFTGGTATTNEAMRINASGYLGIGTANPGNKLEVNSGTGGVSGLRLKELAGGGVLFMNTTADVTENNSNLYFDATNYRLSVAAGVAPSSTLQVGGSLAVAISTKTANYTASVNDHTILCDNTSGGITITLPAVAGVAGRIYVIKKISVAGNNVTVAGNSGVETIDGSPTNVITTQYSSIMIQSDGTSWYILSKN
jgi:hypothetical protein